MQFVAPEKVTGAPEITLNNTFRPDIDLATFLSVMCVNVTVTLHVYKLVALTAMAGVNAEL